mgnify:CR=1 FL=1
MISGHIAQKLAVLRAAPAEEGDDLGNVLRLIADALHVGDHFERSGDLAKIPRDRLLLENEPETERLDRALLFINLRIERRYTLCKRRVSRAQCMGRQRDHLFAARTHFGQLPIELRQLFIKVTSH